MRSPVTPRILVLQHEPETGLGAFAALLDQAHVDYEIVETLRAFLGSVSHNLIGVARCPVLIVPPGVSEAQ